MKLYYLPGACPLASHIVLEWIGQPYEAEAVDRAKLKQPPFTDLNPLGSVPVLVDGDFVLTQSAAILEYLAELHPQVGLLPADPRGRAEVRRWLGLFNADIHRTFGNIFGVAALTADAGFQQELIAKSSARLQQLFAVAEQQLADGKEWIAGTRSIADPYLYTLLRWARAKQVDLSAMPNLQRFHDRMDADAGVKAALKAEGLA